VVRGIFGLTRNAMWRRSPDRQAETVRPDRRSPAAISTYEQARRQHLTVCIRHMTAAHGAPQDRKGYSRLGRSLSPTRVFLAPECVPQRNRLNQQPLSFWDQEKKCPRSPATMERNRGGRSPSPPFGTLAGVVRAGSARVYGAFLAGLLFIENKEGSQNGFPVYCCVKGDERFVQGLTL